MSIHSIVVASSAIESHLDPPAVGDHVAWSLLLLEPDPIFAPDEICCVIDGIAGQVDGSDSGWTGSFIRSGGLVVAVEQVLEQDVRAQLRGLIFEESFDGIPESVPRTAGVIKRIQVLRMEHLPESDGGGGWVPVPGTLKLKEVQSSPQTFDVIEEEDGRIMIETGVLIDLEVAD